MAGHLSPGALHRGAAIVGDKRIICRLRIISTAGEELPEFKMNNADGKHIEGQKTKEGHLEFLLSGSQKIQLNWRFQ